MAETHPIHPRLIRCPDCGMWAGLVDRRKLRESRLPIPADPFAMALCLCDGPLCGRCGKNRILRPISDYYEETDNSLWHVPYFAGMAPCSECRKGEGGGPSAATREQTPSEAN